MKPGSRWLPVTLLLATVVAGCGDGADAPQRAAPPPPEVAVQELAPSAGTHTETLVGRLSALRSAEVRARVSGILLERVYTEGSDVESGELMFRIDPAPLKAELAARQADLASARARAENTRDRAKRVRELAGRGLLPKQDLEDALAAEREAAAAELESKAEVEKARLQLSYADVRAPIAGRAGRAQVTEGALVGDRESTPLATIEQVDSLYVSTEISVANWELLRQMQEAGAMPPLTVVTPGGRTHPHPATVQFSELAVSPRTGTIALRAIVPNPDAALLPGMFVNLQVDVGSAAGEAFVVPQTAVLRDQQGAFVYLLGDDGMVEKRSIEIEGSAGNDWLVKGGLAAGDRLILNGLQRLRPGAPAKAAVSDAAGESTEEEQAAGAES